MIMAYLLPVQSLRIPKRNAIATTYSYTKSASVGLAGGSKKVKEGLKNSGNGGFLECYAKTDHNQVPY